MEERSRIGTGTPEVGVKIKEGLLSVGGCMKVAKATWVVKKAIHPGERSPMVTKTVAVAFCGFLLLNNRAHALIDAELASGDIARAVVGIVGPHNSFCTATAIAHDMLLTAAHCVQPGSPYKGQYKDATGLRQFSDAVDAERAPQYKPGTPTSPPLADLALLKLATPLPSNVGIASLALSGPSVWPGDRFTVIGGGIPFRGLHETGINREAALVAAGPYTSLQIRLVDPSAKEAESGACFGDSGSPVFQVQPNSAKVVGVVSWATGPNKTKGCGGMTGATPLLPYRQWIEGTMTKFGSSSANDVTK